MSLFSHFSLKRSGNGIRFLLRRFVEPRSAKEDARRRELILNIILLGLIGLAAGASASLRGGELLMEEGFAVQVVTLPDGLDPDEILLR